jgi:protein-L-isoaspartate(D-aspartate) O-methyltransferase
MTRCRVRVAVQVRDAMDAVPRRHFLPAALEESASVDRALPIGFQQTNSQPSLVAIMLSLLDVQRGQTVLDVGCGSGWTTAILGTLTGPTGRVVGVELIPELVEYGRGNVEQFSMDHVSVYPAARRCIGKPDAAPYDRILVSADPGRHVPQELIDQLAPTGRMVVPLDGRLCLIEHQGRGVRTTSFGYYPFVPLILD